MRTPLRLIARSDEQRPAVREQTNPPLVSHDSQARGQTPATPNCLLRQSTRFSLSRDGRPQMLSLNSRRAGTRSWALTWRRT